MAGIRIGTPNRKRTSEELAENNNTNDRDRTGGNRDNQRRNERGMIEHNRNGGNGDEQRRNERTMIGCRRREIAWGKIKEIVFKPETMLIVTICTAEEIDRETKDPRGDRRIYQIHGWVIPETGFFTNCSGSLPNPEWYNKYAIPSGLLNTDKSLHLELYRIGSKSDPGPSTGIELVGRAKLKLPKELDLEDCRRQGLVKPGGSADGVLHIKLNVITKEDFYDQYE